MTDDARLASGEVLAAEDELDRSLRPRRLDDFIGQEGVKQQLSIFLEAARQRGEALDHVLLAGPPGLGKTSLAGIVAAELDVAFHVTSGPVLERKGDLAAVLTALEPHDVLFIDEIHRLPIAVEEFFYPAMEDFRSDVPVDSGLNARTVQIKVKPFALIGATTRAGLVSSPLRSRFGITHHLRYYDAAELLMILERSCGLLGLSAETDGALPLIADRSRGTPRIANRLLRRVRDYAQVKGDGRLTRHMVEAALSLEGVDIQGLDELDRSYLRTIATTFRGGPVGLEAVAASMNEDAGTLEHVVEPYLLQSGFLARTRRGRTLTRAGAEHLGLPLPESAASGLFEDE